MNYKHRSNGSACENAFSKGYHEHEQICQQFTCTSATKYTNIPYKHAASDISKVTGQ